MSGQAAVRQTVPTLAKNAFASFPVGDIHVNRFCPSGCWLDGFITQQQFSFRTLHPERQTPINQNYAEYLLKELEAVKLKYSPN
jgi:hypothetical protein